MTPSESVQELIYNWGNYRFQGRNITVFDTTLRDGLQSAQVKRQPTLAEKLTFLHLCHEIGIDAVEIGFPIASESHKKDVIELAKYAKDNKFPMLLSCLSRTTVADVEAVVDVSQKAGVPITVNLLVGSSKIRQFVEHWNLDDMQKWIEGSIATAYKYNLPVEFVTEDTTRSDPETLKFLYSLAIKKGAKRIWIADTVGEATPNSAKNITEFFKKEIIGDAPIGLDWHGHDDKGLGTANALASAEAGADRIQATALGVGERAGNTSMEQVIINLVLANNAPYNLKKLAEYSELASHMFAVPIRDSFPGIGNMVHATAAGMHAAAILKAKKMERDDLEGIVYSALHPGLFGREVEILISPMSGAANVEWHLEKLHVEKSQEIIEKILQYAKKENRTLTAEEIRTLASK